MPPKSLHGVLDNFTKNFGEALKKEKIDIEILEGKYDNPKPFLEKILKNPPDCTLSFNGLLPDEKGVFLCDMLKIPHVACIFDTPAHYFALTKSPYSIVTCVDLDFCDFFKGFNQFKNVIFFPQAAEKNLSETVNKERKIDCLFLGSFIDHEKLRKTWREKLPPVVSNILDNAIDKTLKEEKTSFIQAIVQAINAEMQKKENIDLRMINFEELFDLLVQYVRSKSNVDLLKSIQAPVEIYADFFNCPNIENELSRQKNLHLHSSIPYEEAIKLMKNTKIVLNNSPLYKNGGHERIFCGMAAGALVATGANLYLEDRFVDKEDILFYNYNALKDLNEKINFFLKNEKERTEIASRGQKKVLENDTWQSRAKSLIKDLGPILNSIKATV